MKILLICILRDIGGYNDHKLYNRESALKLRGKVFDNADHIPYVNDVEGKGKVSYIAPPKVLDRCLRHLIQ